MKTEAQHISLAVMVLGPPALPSSTLSISIILVCR
jgi:hypothetical protein